MKNEIEIPEIDLYNSCQSNNDCILIKQDICSSEIVSINSQSENVWNEYLNEVEENYEINCTSRRSADLYKAECIENKCSVIRKSFQELDEEGLIA